MASYMQGIGAGFHLPGLMDTGMRDQEGVAMEVAEDMVVVILMEGQTLEVGMVTGEE